MKQKKLKNGINVPKGFFKAHNEGWKHNEGDYLDCHNCNFNGF